MPTDYAALYADVRARFTGLARDLDDDTLARPVPACPAWTVRDLVAHATGVAADFAAGNLPTGDIEEWTAAQVDKRRGTGLADLLAEWDGTGVEAAIPNLPGPLPAILTIDLVAHEHDLRAAVARPAHDDPDITVALRGYGRTFGSRVDENGLPAVRIEAGDWSTVAGSGEPAVTLRGTPYDVFRSLGGRRTEAEVRDLDWDGDPTPYLPILSPFGPLPATSGG